MANIAYLTLTGQLQGLISAGCSSLDSIGNKAQIVHIDQIMILGLTHGITRDQNVNHQTFSFIKPVDKSSPLLGKAITENEILTCDFDFYRTNRAGNNELYYKVKLTNARISDIHLEIPHIIDNNSSQPEETIFLIYETINWEHCIAGTSSFSLRDNRIF